MRGLERDFSLFDGQVAEMLAVDDADLALTVPGVSRWSVGQQLDHLSRVGTNVLTAMGKAVETGTFGEVETRLRMKFVGKALLGAAWFPRGVARAPRSAMPDGASEPAEIRFRLTAMREAMGTLRGRGAEVLAMRTRMKHPRLGGLTPRQWVRFLFVHQRHHLKIVRDIRRASRRS
jgi:DinB family protein